MFGLGLGSFGLGSVHFFIIIIFFPRGGRRGPRPGAAGREGGDPLAIEMPPVKAKKQGFWFSFLFPSSSSFPPFHCHYMHVGVFVLSTVKK